MSNYEHLPNDTRVWVYQSSRRFSAEEQNNIQTQLQAFSKEWVSHSRQLRAAATLLHEQFIVLMVDESQAGASGCSIDASVHFLKQLEQEYSIRLFDRLTFAYEAGEQVKTAERTNFAAAYAKGEITDETIVFDNLVKTKGEFVRAWRKPLGQSWHKQMV